MTNDKEKPSADIADQTKPALLISIKQHRRLHSELVSYGNAIISIIGARTSADVKEAMMNAACKVALQSIMDIGNIALEPDTAPAQENA